MAVKSTLLNSILIPSISIPLLAFSIITFYTVYLSIENDRRIKTNYASVLATNIIDKIERNYYERFGDVQAFAYNATAIAALKDTSKLAELTAYMNTMTNYYVLYDLMMVIDEKGNVVAVNCKDKLKKDLNTQEVFIGRNFSQENWFTEAKYGIKDGAWYSDFQANPDIAKINNDNDNGYGVAFVAAIIDRQGQFQGAWYNFSSWLEITQKMHAEMSAALKEVYPNAHIIITDKEYKIIDADNMAVVKNGEMLNLNQLEESNIVEVATGKGAYTFKGNSWKVFVLINDSNTFLTMIKTHYILILVCIICLLITCITVYYVSTSIANKLIAIKDNIVRLSSGELTTLHVKGQAEIELMADSINQLVDGLKDKSLFAEKIGNGQLQSEYTPSSDNDVLGKSLLSMRNNLFNNAEEERQRNWVSQGINQFSDLLRSNQDLIVLLNTLLSSIIDYTKAQQGAIYLMNDSDQDESGLEMLACYAYDRKKFLAKRIAAGEGLVGQTFLENKTTYLSEIPSGMTISSGLGEAQPRFMLLVPISTNEETLGILQLASLYGFEDYQISFVEKISDSLAATIQSAKVNEKTKKLLHASQEQTEQLRAQEEELRQNMEELCATQEEINRKETEYLQRIKVLEEEASGVTVRK